MSRDGFETRERILKSTLKLLEKKHKTGVRMVDIAKEAGITRQALYLHFKTRAALLIAVTYYLDEQKGGEKRLIASRTAHTGKERLDAFVDAWCNYIPEIHGTAKALMDMSATDEAAAKAWGERMQDMKEGCAAAINALDKDAMLSPDYLPDIATDLLWTLLSVRNWELLTIDCGWSQDRFVSRMKSMTQQLFVRNSNDKAH